MSNSTDIDYKEFEKNTGFDKEVQKELYQSLINNIDNYKNNLINAVKESKIELIKLHAHSIKSSVSYFGLTKLKQNFDEIEKNPSKNKDELLFDIHLYFADLKFKLKELDKYIYL